MSFRRAKRSVTPRPNINQSSTIRRDHSQSLYRQQQQQTAVERKNCLEPTHHTHRASLPTAPIATPATPVPPATAVCSIHYTPPTDHLAPRHRPAASPPHPQSVQYIGTSTSTCPTPQGTPPNSAKQELPAPVDCCSTNQSHPRGSVQPYHKTRCRYAVSRVETAASVRAL